MYTETFFLIGLIPGQDVHLYLLTPWSSVLL